MELFETSRPFRNWLAWYQALFPDISSVSIRLFYTAMNVSINAQVLQKIHDQFQETRNQIVDSNVIFDATERPDLLVEWDFTLTPLADTDPLLLDLFRLGKLVLMELPE